MTRPSRRGLGGSLLLGALALAAVAVAELRELPDPLLDNLEPPVREQLIAERDGVERELERYRAGEIDAERLAEAYGALGRLYYLNDFRVAAETAFLNAIELTPSVFEWRYYLGALYPVDGRLEEAETLLTSALEIRSDYLPALIRLGRVQLDLGKLDAARDRFEAALKLDGSSAAAHQGLGRVAFEGGDLEQAIDHFELVLEIQPEANLMHHQLGLAYRELGDRERALEHLRQNRHQDVRLDDPLVQNLYQIVRSGKLHFNSAIELLEADQPEAAIEQLRLAIERQPGQFTYHHNLANALDLLGRTDEAIVEYRKTLELNPEYPIAHFNLAMILADRGELEAAAHHLELAHRHDPADLITHTEWATALSRIGQAERAAAELSKVLDKDPTFGRALLNLATVQAQLGRTAAAAATLERLIDGDSTAEERAAGHYRMGRIHEERREVARAVESYRAAVALTDDLLDAHVALAGLLARGGRFAEAADHFGRAVELDPEDRSSHFGRGLALVLGERYLEARRSLEQSVERHSDDLALAHLLARLLATAPPDEVRDGERALALAQDVFARQQSIEHAETLAMALAETGRFEDAARWQRDILDRARPGAPAETLAPLERRLGQYERGEPVRAPWRG